jgi:hypothetical protein
MSTSGGVRGGNREEPSYSICVPGMALILEVEVLYGPIGRNR